MVYPIISLSHAAVVNQEQKVKRFYAPRGEGILTSGVSSSYLKGAGTKDKTKSAAAVKRLGAEFFK